MKKKRYNVKLFAFMMIFSSLSIITKGNTRVDELVCEYHTNPIGIDVQKPRLSWKIFSDKENVSQVSYEIRVADSPSSLNKASRQIWNSGKVNSSQSVNVEYQGLNLNRHNAFTGR